MYCSLNCHLKIQPYDYLNKKYTSINEEKKNSYDRILRGKPKEQHLSTVPKVLPIKINEYFTFKLHNECMLCETKES